MLPLSQILDRLDKLNHANTRELRELVFALAIHTVNLNNKLRGLEARLDRTQLYLPGDQVTGG